MRLVNSTMSIKVLKYAMSIKVLKYAMSIKVLKYDTNSKCFFCNNVTILDIKIGSQIFKLHIIKLQSHPKGCLIGQE